MDSSTFFLLGFALAGFAKILLPETLIRSSIGKSNFWSVLKSTLIGLPLPLCSCSVLPTAMAMRRSGASRGATMSFLISTPETGVDSITISYGLLDPLLTVFRPIAAMITALITGVVENLFGDDKEESVPLDEGRAEGEKHSHDAIANDCCNIENNLKVSSTALAAFRYAFVELFDDIAGWMLVGIIAAGLVNATLPAGFMGYYFGDGVWSLLVMLILGIPVYICATSSTPFAAALMLNGLSPGAALVFLLAGPGTNISSVIVIRKFMGMRSTIIYLLSLSISIICLGATLNWIYQYWGIEPTAVIGEIASLLPQPIEITSSLVFLFLCTKSLLRKFNLQSVIKQA
ncbi:MAG TPA: SO_0444 family Cu/Zn efflux transporter [Nitrospinota bacterium]|nr:SO_0444 family Cu/Zn efflux transporter [Nitrospinota bacterium]